MRWRASAAVALTWVALVLLGFQAAGVAGKPRMRFVYSTECSSYMDFQVFVFERSFQELHQDAKLTRLIACDDPKQVLPASEHGLIADTHVHPRAATHRFSHDVYTPYNRPYGFQHWFQNAPPEEELIVIIDPDMMQARALTLDDLPPIEQIKGRPIMQYYGYLAERGFVNGLQKYTMNIEDARAIGCPMIFHRDDLREVAPWWHLLTELVRESPQDRQLTLDAGWTSEMYGMAFALSDLGMVPTTWYKFMVYPNYGYSSALPYFIHWGIYFEREGVKFDKHQFSYLSPLSCDAKDFPVWGKAPPMVFPRVTTESCYDARSRAVALVFTNFLERIIRDFRVAAKCDPVSRFEAPEPFEFESDMFRKIDRLIGCEVEYTPEVAPEPPLPAPPNIDALQATERATIAALRGAAATAADTNANVVFVLVDDASPEATASLLTLAESMAAVGETTAALQHIRAASPYAPASKILPLLPPHVHVFTLRSTITEHHLLGRWYAPYNTAWGLGHWTAPTATEGPAGREHAVAIPQSLLVLMPRGSVLVRPWNVPLWLLTRDGAARTGAAALVRGAPVAAECASLQPAVQAAFDAFTQAEYGSVPALGCFPLIVHRDDARGLAKHWMRALSRLRRSAPESLTAAPAVLELAFSIAVAQAQLPLTVLPGMAVSPGAPTLGFVAIREGGAAGGCGIDALSSAAVAAGLACDAEWSQPTAAAGGLLGGDIGVLAAGCERGLAVAAERVCAVAAGRAVQRVRTALCADAGPAAATDALATDASWQRAASAAGCKGVPSAVSSFRTESAASTSIPVVPATGPSTGAPPLASSTGDVSVPAPVPASEPGDAAASGTALFGLATFMLFGCVCGVALWRVWPVMLSYYESINDNRYKLP